MKQSVVIVNYWEIKFEYSKFSLQDTSSDWFDRRVKCKRNFNYFTSHGQTKTDHSFNFFSLHLTGHQRRWFRWHDITRHKTCVIRFPFYHSFSLFFILQSSVRRSSWVSPTTFFKQTKKIISLPQNLTHHLAGWKGLNFFQPNFCVTELRWIFWYHWTIQLLFLRTATDMSNV